MRLGRSGSWRRMGWLERADRNQQRVADDTRRDGTTFSTHSKRFLGVWLGVSVLVLVALFVAAVAASVGG